MLRFKFYIMYQGTRRAEYALGNTLMQAFNEMINRYPNCIYINHVEITK